MPKDKKLDREPVAHKSKRKLTFFSLPGELRNNVYTYYYEAKRKVLGNYWGWTPQYLSDVRRQSVPTASLMDLRNPKFRADLPQDRYAMGELHLASKQVHAEVLPLLYSTVTFCAYTTHILRQLVRDVPSCSLKFVGTLHLAHQTYGPPRDANHEILRLKHQRSWERTCIATAQALPNLNTLYVILDVCDAPPRFTLYERWVLALYPFAIHCTKLASVNIHVLTQELDRCYINPKDTKKWCKNYYLWHIQGLVARYEACKRLHRLFGDAVGKKILGAGDEEAMEEYRKAAEEVDAGWDFVFCS